VFRFRRTTATLIGIGTLLAASVMSAIPVTGDGSTAIYTAPYPVMDGEVTFAGG
jgi:hypothetical protein